MQRDSDGEGDNADNDGDGWPDSTEDNCGSDSMDSASVPDDLDDDGMCDNYDLDDDGDGVWDEVDDCPTETGWPENRGCPSAEKSWFEGSDVQGTLLLLGAVLFLIGSGFVLQLWVRRSRKQKKEGVEGEIPDRVVFGLVLCIGGLIATKISYDSARFGEEYSVYFSAVLWGLYEILAGLSGSDKKKSNEEGVDGVEEIDGSDTGDSE